MADEIVAIYREMRAELDRRSIMGVAPVQDVFAVIKRTAQRCNCSMVDVMRAVLGEGK